MIIGVTGTISAGKGEFAKILKERGFEHFGFGTEVREESRKRGMEQTRLNWQKLGNDMRKDDPAYWCKRIAAKMKEGNNYIIEGLRNPGDVEFFKDRQDFFLVALDAPINTRWERLVSRGDSENVNTFEDFIKVNNIDLGLGQEGFGQQNAKVMAMARYKIENVGTLHELRNKVNALVDELMRKNK